MTRLESIAPKGEVNPEGGGLSRLGTNYEIASQKLEDEPRKEKALSRFDLRRLARRALYDTRICDCGNKVMPRKNCVEVRKGQKGVFFKNVISCGSVWVCAPCAFKVALNNAKEIGDAIKRQEERGGQVIMVTETVVHKAHQSLYEVLEGVTKARERRGRQRAFRSLCDDVGLEGRIRALEITYGKNGWHVHIHELWFIEPGRVVYRVKLQERLLALWKDACVKSGMKEPGKRGINVDAGADKGKYVSKWGLECEVALSDRKLGREGNMTPWELLEHGLYHVFREYAQGVKGKKRVQWTDGLRELLDLPRGKSDPEVANEEEVVALLLYVLDLYDWKSIVRRDRVEELRKVAEEEGREGIERFLRTVFVCTDEVDKLVGVYDPAFV